VYGSPEKKPEKPHGFLLFKFNVLYVDVKLLELGVLLDRIKAVSGKKSCTQSRVIQHFNY